MKRFLLAAAVLLTIAALPVHASGDPALDAARAAVTESMPGVSFDLRHSPVPGIFELRMGSFIVYITGDARYIFNGDLLDAKTRHNLRNDARAETVTTAIQKIPDRYTIVFNTSRKPVFTITAFVDVGCPYCAHFMRDVDSITAKGIRVRVLFFPRDGLTSPAYKKAVSVWCNKDRQTALRMVMDGGDVPTAVCAAPILKSFNIAQDLALSATPAFVLANGQVFYGYRDVNTFLTQIGVYDTRVSKDSNNPVYADILDGTPEQRH